MKDYKKILEGVMNIINTTEISDIGFANICAYISENCPELAESADERIRKAIICGMTVHKNQGKETFAAIPINDCIAWLEKQGEKMSNPRYSILAKLIEADDIYQMSVNASMVKEAKNKAIDALSKLEISKLLGLEKQDETDKASYEIAEKEKHEFVGDGFIKCHANFQDFKEGETYWLEYLGNDNYNVRSDNLLGKTYHITPCQLYTIFKKQTWLEKQGEKPQGKSAFESAKEEKVDNQNCVKPADKVEPKFKVGDWFVGNSNKEIFLIKSVNSGYCILEDVKGRIYSPCLPPTEVDYHLWTIADAKDGDVLSYRDGQWIFIYKKQVDDNSFHYYSLYSTIHQDLTIDDSAFTLLIDGIVPATKEQRDLLFQKMHEAGYEWDSEKKQPRKIEQKPAENEELTEFDKAVGVSIGTWNPKSPEQIQSVKAVSKKLLKLAKKQINDEQKPWSEEVEAAITLLKDIAEEQEKDYCPHNANDLRKAAQYLETCRPQNTLKPSDEHYELEEFAKIVRCNLTGISKAVQQLFETKYLQLTGNKMYEGFKD